MAKKKGLTQNQDAQGDPERQYRKLPSIKEFEERFVRREGVPVLKQFFESANSTATWVQSNFAPLELEVHQLSTVGKGSRQSNQPPDYAAIKKQFPYLAVVATDGELKQILEATGKNPKDLAADILSRILHRNPSSIKKWAQRKSS